MSDRQADILGTHGANRGAEAEAFTRVLGRNVRERRKDVGLTQDELAGQANLSRASIANIERGMQSPQIFSLALVARALECGVADLVPEEMIGTGELALSSDSRAAVERVLRGAHRLRSETER